MNEPTGEGSQNFPRYGDIWDANFDPVIGTEIAKRRPAQIVSNNFNNEYTSRITVLPLTSRLSKREYPFQVFVSKGIAGLTLDSRILANQIRTIDKKRLVSFRGTLPAEYLPRVVNAMKIHLNMVQ